MKQTVCSAQIDKSAEVCDILDCTADDIAHIELGEKLLLTLHLLLDKQLFAVADDTVAARVELCDDKLDLLILILGQVTLIGIRHKTGRDKHLGLVDHDTQSTAKHLSDLSCQDLSGLTGFTKLLIALLGRETLVGQNYLSVPVVDFKDLDCHLVTDIQHFCEIDIGVVRILAARKHTIVLVADIEDRFLRLYIDDLAIDDFPVADLLKCFIQHLFKQSLFF